MSEKDIHIDKWAKQARDRIDQFVEIWKEEHEKDPEDWPIEMWPGDWDESKDDYWRGFEDAQKECLVKS